jgi:hypothetical protein
VTGLQTTEYGHDNDKPKDDENKDSLKAGKERKETFGKREHSHY